jgi:hypothetical protein
VRLEVVAECSSLGRCMHLEIVVYDIVEDEDARG